MDAAIGDYADGDDDDNYDDDDDDDDDDGEDMMTRVMIADDWRWFSNMAIEESMDRFFWFKTSKVRHS